MDYTTPVVPPIPRRQHAPRKSLQGPSSSAQASSSKTNGQTGPNATASPEVISSLITSLSDLSKPAYDGIPSLGPHFPGLPAPTSPQANASAANAAGSFGVDYGAFSQPSLLEVAEEDTPLDELAASPPVIRTAKPPSGFSALTAPKSPKAENAGAGIKAILRSASRPSSKGSIASKDADAVSIGNLSIERGVVPAASAVVSSGGGILQGQQQGQGQGQHELRRQRSHDSWGKKQGRAQRGLMYMSSKEQLREKELEKKRASVGAVGGNPIGLGGPAGMTIAMMGASGRPDPFLAETAISEEPSTNGDSPVRNDGASRSSPRKEVPSPRPIPARDSSLRKTGANAKSRVPSTSSARNSTASRPGNKRDDDTIHESEGQYHGSSSRQREIPRRKHHLQQPGRTDSLRSVDVVRGEIGGQSAGASRQMRDSRELEDLRSSGLTTTDVDTTEHDLTEDSAPFPAVAQGRRRQSHELGVRQGRRRSGRNTPDAVEVTLRPKRSSSKLKRLSGPLSPRGGSPEPGYASGSNNGGGGGNNSNSNAAAAASTAGTAHVGYERPDSADSIDDAVESYLCSPRLSQKIRHPQTGRVISFSEVGDSEGSAVFCCVGMGLTRYITAFYDELALTLKLRLITPDRPGVGDSEPYADGTATPLSWPDDVYAICQALKITKFSILAHSAGAIYALATALRMPQHIRGRIHLLAPWIPPSQMSVFGTSQTLPPTNAIPTSQRILRALPTPILKAANSSFMSATSSSITSSLPKTQRKGKRKSASTGAATGRDTPALSTKAPTPSPDKENMASLDESGKPLDGSYHGPPSTTTPTASGDMDLIRPSGVASAASVDGAKGQHHARNATSTSAHSILSAAAAAALAAEQERERQSAYDTRLTHAIWELATTGANPAVDLLVCLERRHTIGFRYVDITRPVVIHHGSRDTRVPVENVRWLGRTMRRCEVRVLEGEGHGLMASAGVMGSVLMEIANEWEDWMRVTGSGPGTGGSAGSSGRDGGKGKSDRDRERDRERERERERDRERERERERDRDRERERDRERMRSVASSRAADGMSLSVSRTEAVRV